MNHSRSALAALTTTLALLTACATPTPSAPWTPLFDGATLDGWHVTEFGGQGEVTIQDGALHLAPGNPLTGVTLQSTPPSGNYELEVVAARLEGVDFFCGLTFPVGDSHLTLVLGGWGGSTCGLSNIDDNDASNNATMKLKGFKAGRDYTVLLRVTEAQIEVLLDGEPFTSTPRNGAVFSLRPEVDICKPLGISSFCTLARIKTLRWRPLTND